MSAHSTATNICGSIDAVRAQFVAEINGINARFAAARRTVQLLAGAARRFAVPPIPQLPTAIDISSYNRLRAACPLLNLPQVDASILGEVAGIAQIEKLRQLIQGAAQNAIDKLERTPLGLIDQLQTGFDRELSKLLNKLNPLDSILQCACAAADIVLSPEENAAQKTWNSIKTFPEQWSVTSGDFSGELSQLREARDQLSAVVSGR